MYRNMKQFGLVECYPGLTPNIVFILQNQSSITSASVLKPKPRQIQGNARVVLQSFFILQSVVQFSLMSKQHFVF